MSGSDTAKWSGSHVRPFFRGKFSRTNSSAMFFAAELGDVFFSFSSECSKAISRSAISRTACQNTRCFEDVNAFVCSFFLIWFDRIHDNAPIQSRMCTNKGILGNWVCAFDKKVEIITSCKEMLFANLEEFILYKYIIAVLFTAENCCWGMIFFVLKFLNNLKMSSCCR